MNFMTVFHLINCVQIVLNACLELIEQFSYHELIFCQFFIVFGTIFVRLCVPEIVGLNEATKENCSSHRQTYNLFVTCSFRMSHQIMQTSDKKIIKALFLRFRFMSLFKFSYKKYFNSWINILFFRNIFF